MTLLFSDLLPSVGLFEPFWGHNLPLRGHTQVICGCMSPFYPFHEHQPLSARVHYALEGPCTYRTVISVINEALAGPGTLMTLILPRTLVAFMALVCKNIVRKMYICAKLYWPITVHKVLTIPDKFPKYRLIQSPVVWTMPELHPTINSDDPMFSDGPIWVKSLVVRFFYWTNTSQLQFGAIYHSDVHLSCQKR